MGFHGMGGGMSSLSRRTQKQGRKTDAPRSGVLQPGSNPTFPGYPGPDRHSFTTILGLVNPWF